jgi:hypothetical protein
MFFTRIGGWGLCQPHVLWLWRKQWRRGEETRKHGVYSGAKCSIMEHGFSLNTNCFVECICMQRIKYSWILYINSRAWLYKSTPFFPIRKQGYNTVQRKVANLKPCISPASASVIWLLNRLAPAVYQQTSFVVIGHSQRAELDSVAILVKNTIM